MSSQVVSSVDATGLFQLIEDEDWSDAILQIKECPEEAKTWVIRSAGKSKFRRLPLHEALMRKAPGEVVECLLTANPDASKACDDTGRLPLHHAIFHGAEMKVVTKLVMEYPEALDFVDKGGLKPLGIAMLGSSTEKENLVAFLSKGSVFYAVQKEENKWVQREHDLKKELETMKKGLEDKVEAKIAERFTQRIAELEAARAEEFNKNEQLIAKLAALENEKLHHALPSNSNEQTRSEQALVIEECQKRIAELETQLATQAKNNVEAGKQLVLDSEPKNLSVQEMSDMLEPLVAEREMQIATLSAKCDKLQMEYSEKSQAYEEALAKIEFISAEKDLFNSRAKESDQRLNELAEQLAAWTMKYHNLSTEYNTKILEAVSAEKELVQQQAKDEYEHRIAVLDEQVTSLGKIREDLVSENIAKTKAYDESVKKIADLEFTIAELKKSHEQRYNQVTMQCLQLEELAKSKYSENLKLMEDLQTTMLSQEQLASMKLAEASLTAEKEQLQEELSSTRKELETANQSVTEAGRKIDTLLAEKELLMKKIEDNTQLLSLIVTNASEYQAKTSQAVNTLESDFAQIQTERFESVTTKYQTLLEKVCT